MTREANVDRVVPSVPRGAADCPPALSPTRGGHAAPRYGRRRAAIRIPTAGCSPRRFYQTCVNIEARAAPLESIARHGRMELQVPNSAPTLGTSSASYQLAVYHW